MRALAISGVAGGIDPAFTIGDTVSPSEWRELSTERVATVNPHMTEIARRLEHVKFSPLGVTADHFVSNASDMPQGVSVVDMETYAIASVAERYQVPWIAFRSVSDFANGDFGAAHVAQAAEASASTTLAFIRLY